MTGDESPRCRSMRMRRVNEADSMAHTEAATWGK